MIEEYKDTLIYKVVRCRYHYYIQQYELVEYSDADIFNAQAKYVQACQEWMKRKDNIKLGKGDSLVIKLKVYDRQNKIKKTLKMCTLAQL